MGHRPGTLVVLPKANVRGVRHERREWPPGMDLNRKFPIGEPPTNALAKAVWSAIEEYDPDLFIDLHSSKGILRREGDEGVGQNVFRSKHDEIVTSVDAAVERLNDEYVTGYKPVYDFVHTPVSETKLRHNADARQQGAGGPRRAVVSLRGHSGRRETRKVRSLDAGIRR
ncbi:hypothetical protein [Haladaptatus sp. W1]|uniref:hypothetical protein n=1 Tax=Haladaptatus sp. W1 TaxID=1897478 RepID=UPI0020C74E65|nr:hypothetical protein [Haladaptatus sp. W1]